MASSLYNLLPSGPSGLKGLTPLGPPSQVRNNPAQEKRLLAQATVELEALFLNHLLKELRRTLVETIAPNTGSGKGYQALADEHFTRALASCGGLGLAQKLLEQLAPKYVDQIREKHHGESASNHPNEFPGDGDPALPAAP